MASRERIVLSGVRYGRRELAIVPVDGDIGELQAALAGAGVKGGQAPSERLGKERSPQLWVVILLAAILLVLILTVGNHVAMLVFGMTVFGLLIRELVKNVRGRRG